MNSGDPERWCLNLIKLMMHVFICLFQLTTDSEDSALLEKYDWWFVPIANPDGYAYSWTQVIDLFFWKSLTNQFICLVPLLLPLLKFFMGVSIRNFDDCQQKVNKRFLPRNRSSFEVLLGGISAILNDCLPLAFWFSLNPRQKVIRFSFGVAGDDLWALQGRSVVLRSSFESSKIPEFNRTALNYRMGWLNFIKSKDSLEFPPNPSTKFLGTLNTSKM